MRFGKYLPLVCIPLAVSMGCGTDSAVDPALPEESFDLQAHRGGLGLVTESTIESFTNALQLGVSTLELDTQITEDGIAIVTHDRKVSDSKCVDTGAVTPGDPEFPYVGKFVNTLTLAQIRTLDCGALTLTDYPEQRRVPGARMPTLVEVLDLVKSADAPGVKLNVETKVEAGSPTETAPREQFVDTVLATIRDAGMLDRVTVQSFDWGALTLVREAEPEVPVVALTNGDFLQVGQDGASPPGVEPVGTTIEVAGWNRHRRLRRGCDRRDRFVRGVGVLAGAGDPAERQGRRSRLRALRNPGHGGLRPRARNSSDPVDRRRSRHDACTDGSGRRRPDHRLPRPVACRHERARTSSARARQVTVPGQNGKPTPVNFSLASHNCAARAGSCAVLVMLALPGLPRVSNRDLGPLYVPPPATSTA